MNFFRLFTVVISFFLAAAFACVSAIPQAGKAELAATRVRFSDVDAETLERGRNLYIAKCSGCHPLYDPHGHKPIDWIDIVEKMSGKAAVGKVEKNEIIYYLFGVSAAGRN